MVRTGLRTPVMRLRTRFNEHDVLNIMTQALAFNSEGKTPMNNSEKVSIINGVRDVVDEVNDLRKRIQEAQNTISCLTASRDRWKAEAKGKITPEWQAIYEAGAKPIEG